MKNLDLSVISSSFYSLIEGKYTQSDYLLLDLSVTNSSLSNFDISSPTSIQAYIDQQYQRTNKKIAYGGYLEKRGIYQRSDYFRSENSKHDRSIHLGVDIWSHAKSGVLAPLEGKIHSFANNDKFGDYGPTIILEHNLNSSTFYTLYGHLSKQSIETISIGEQIMKGQRFSELGTTEENGNYAPHLHFQIILDLHGNKGDYPGVCSESDLAFYMKNCPDPNLLLKFD